MVRVYLSPTASAFIKAGLLFAEVLIGLFNILSYPIRNISFMAYFAFTSAVSVGLGLYFKGDVSVILGMIATVIIVSASVIVLTNVLYNYLKKKVSPRIAVLFNSPFGIPTNRYYKF